MPTFHNFRKTIGNHRERGGANAISVSCIEPMRLEFCSEISVCQCVCTFCDSDNIQNTAHGK